MGDLKSEMERIGRGNDNARPSGEPRLPVCHLPHVTDIVAPPCPYSTVILPPTAAKVWSSKTSDAYSGLFFRYMKDGGFQGRD